MSDFARDDIELTLNEIFSEMGTDFLFRVKIGGARSADHLCTDPIRCSSDQRFSWPEMSSDQALVFKELLPGLYGGGVPPHYYTNQDISTEGFFN